jgi:hypothetical protein
MSLCPEIDKRTLIDSYTRDSKLHYSLYQVMVKNAGLLFFSKNNKVYHIEGLYKPNIYF